MDNHPEKKWECSKCSKRFKTRTELNRHLATHDPNARVKCKICGKLTKSLASHMWGLHSNRERPMCDTCHRVFATFPSLRQHIDTVHSTKDRPRFPCTFPGCEKSYLFKNDVSKHVRAEHAENPVRFPCSLCGKEFKSRGDLEHHIPTHTTEKPYNCATYGKGFVKKGKMKRHENTHLEIFTRAVSHCHICLQTFLGRNGLQNHIRFVHENRRDYPCTFCDKRCSTSSNLRRHVESRHAKKEDPIYSCDKCEYTTHVKSNLVMHARRHSTANHECYFCRRKFDAFQYLIRTKRFDFCKQIIILKNI
ncbi:zinc finger protein 333 isoform X2 [Folsomia candida]|uniref:zinc finger protein 333 isoform X2 n=1 Tax=Folsomia candida TaxID=158441 RepID=UPI001604B643|nr:zinc finger protein 333 isoform X2 [Folsomia candida]